MNTADLLTAIKEFEGVGKMPREIVVTDHLPEERNVVPMGDVIYISTALLEQIKSTWLKESAPHTCFGRLGVAAFPNTFSGIPVRTARAHRCASITRR